MLLHLISAIIILTFLPSVLLVIRAVISVDVLPCLLLFDIILSFLNTFPMAASELLYVLFDLLVVLILIFELQIGRLIVQRIGRIRIQQQLRQKSVENVDQVIHW